MNKEEYNQIIKEAYEKYHQENKKVMYLTFLLEEEFIRKIKTDNEFSQKWGLYIEERKLSSEERCDLGYKYVDPFEWDMLMGGGKEGDEGNCNVYNIPTKLITIKYKNETIECYE